MFYTEEYLSLKTCWILGYNTLIVLPEGATSITLQEEGTSKNYFGMSNFSPLTIWFTFIIDHPVLSNYFIKIMSYLTMLFSATISKVATFFWDVCHCSCSKWKWCLLPQCQRTLGTSWATVHGPDVLWVPKTQLWNGIPVCLRAIERNIDCGGRSNPGLIFFVPLDRRPGELKS